MSFLLSILIASAAGSPVAPTRATPASQQTTQPSPWIVKGRHANWGIVCNPANQQDCRGVQNVTYANGQDGSGQLLELVFIAGKDKAVLFAKFPLGVDLRAGTALKIGQAPEISGTYVTCMPDGCQSFFPLTPAHVDQMKIAKTMSIGFRSMSMGNKTAVVESSLEKFDEVIADLKG